MNRDDAPPEPEPIDPAALSDDALLAEVLRRRRRRGAMPRQDERPHRLSPTELARHLASLEVGPDATLPDVERAYETLQARYAPFAQHEDEGRRAAARKLLDSLKTAHEALIKHFS